MWQNRGLLGVNLRIKKVRTKLKESIRQEKDYLQIRQILKIQI